MPDVPEIWPPLLTPYAGDGSVDHAGLRALIEFYVAAGVSGLLVTGLSAEPFTLTFDERKAILETCLDTAAGRIAIAAAAFPDDCDGDAAAAAADVHRRGASVAVLLASLLAPEGAGDAAVTAELSRIVDSTQGDLGLYEAPRPFKRLLADETLAYAAGSGRFVFLKDTCEDLTRIQRRLTLLSGSRLKLLNANMATFRQSVAMGASGFCGLIANVFPAALRPAALSADDSLSLLLTAADTALERDYPASAKCLLADSYGLPIGNYARNLRRGTVEANCRGLFAAARLVERMGGSG